MGKGQIFVTACALVFVSRSDKQLSAIRHISQGQERHQGSFRDRRRAHFHSRWKQRRAEGETPSLSWRTGMRSPSHPRSEGRQCRGAARRVSPDGDRNPLAQRFQVKIGIHFSARRSRPVFAVWPPRARPQTGHSSPPTSSLSSSRAVWADRCPDRSMHRSAPAPWRLKKPWRQR